MGRRKKRALGGLQTLLCFRNARVAAFTYARVAAFTYARVAAFSKRALWLPKYRNKEGKFSHPQSTDGFSILMQEMDFPSSCKRWREGEEGKQRSPSLHENF